MHKFKTLAMSRLAVFIGSAVLALLMTWPIVGAAQDKTDKAKAPDPHAQHKDKQPPGDKTLASQIAELHAKVAKLEAALKQAEKGTPSGTTDKGGLAGKDDKTGEKPPGGRVSAQFQNCVQCHQTRPSGPLPPSHLDKPGVKDVGTKEGGNAETGDNKGDEKSGGVGDKKMGKGMDAMDPDEMMGQMMQKMGEMMQMMGKMNGKGMSSMGDKMKGMGMKDKDMKGMKGMKGMEMKDKGMGMKEKGMAMGMKEKGMGMKEKGMGMGMGMKEMMGKGPKDAGDMAGMKDMMGKGPKDAGDMAGMKGMTKMQKGTALPAFPGAAEIYHIGASDFFIDLSDDINLTTEQQTTLNSLKEKALLEKSTTDGKIEKSDQELWNLTGSDRPDATKIDAMVREVEKLRGDQRLAFIRSVGEAAKVLTDEQRQALLGHAKPQDHKDHQPPAK